MILLFLNIGTPELMLILFVVLLLFGGKKLPEIAKGLGKGIREFKDASEGIKRDLNSEINNFADKAKNEHPEQASSEDPENQD
ncbi:twin-arginine translocase TatA/TatE family subunit [Pedobacter sp. BS3]|uniref:Sec-independent protein translocase subunit TatA/TatB n=1 Tax=Pedobacter sp. BS3 TaxID=2567937 RepID=UPI0011EEA9B2|nr:twin-arginine translocase TatA/TatE family subunit [Pedobacter sp. BS3]TZF83611.1 twin-arginine translocase TatA/TatE family subunit [Pedobacter sp. BS3]